MKHHQATFRPANKAKGFTLIELLVGSAIMLIMIIGALTIYSQSNKISVDQQQYAEIQHNVRSSVYLVARDARMAGAGLPEEFLMWAVEGVDNEDQGAASGVTPDRLKIMGNIDEPLSFRISDYNGSSENVSIDDFSFEQYPYPDSYYDNKIVLVFPNPASSCTDRKYRLTSQVIHNTGATNEKLGFASGQGPGINPPGGLSDDNCSANDYIGGLITIINIREYWLDVTGEAAGCTDDTDGYIGHDIGGVLYITDEYGMHYPLASDIENLQFEYNGDLDDSGTMDGFVPWNTGASSPWGPDEISRIRQVRIMILGRTPNRFVSVSGTPPGGIHLYRRPAVSNTNADGHDDMHRRFLMETTSNIRNMSLNLYNTGER